MTSPTDNAVSNELEKTEQLTDSAAGSVVSRMRDLSTFTDGYRDDWRAYFSTAVRKTLKRRQMALKAQCQRPYRYAGVLSIMFVLTGLCMLTATVASAKTITVTGTGDTIAVDGQ